MTAATPPASPHPGLGTREMIALIAAIMAVNALGIDSMLPALPAIGEALGVAEENRRQWVIAIFAFGLGSTQLIYGPLADRYGRKPVMRWSLGLYVLASLWAAVASSFSMLLVARFIQGATSAATRVITTSVVRDCYAGRDMARVMSLAFMIFLGVPIFAPSIGQAILHVAPWPGIFVFLAVFAGAVLLWAQIRLPETLAPEKRRPIEPRQIAAAMRAAFCDRYSLGYTLAGTVLFGALLGFISSAQQLFSETFDAHDRFPLIFALIAMGMGVAAWLNSLPVEAPAS